MIAIVSVFLKNFKKGAGDLVNFDVMKIVKIKKTQNSFTLFKNFEIFGKILDLIV